MNLKKILAGVAFTTLLFAQSCRETDAADLPEEKTINQESLKRKPIQDSIVTPPILPSFNSIDPKDSPGK